MSNRIASKNSLQLLFTLLVAMLMFVETAFGAPVGEIRNVINTPWVQQLVGLGIALGGLVYGFGQLDAILGLNFQVLIRLGGIFAIAWFWPTIALAIVSLWG